MSNDEIQGTHRYMGLHFVSMGAGSILMLTVGLVLSVVSIVRPSAPRSLPILAVAALLLTARGIYWSFWRLSYQLEVTHTVFRWRSLLRHGEIPLSKLERVRFASYVPWKGKQADHPF